MLLLLLLLLLLLQHATARDVKNVIRISSSQEWTPWRTRALAQTNVRWRAGALARIGAPPSMIGTVVHLLKPVPILLCIVIINYNKIVRAARPRASAEVQISLR